MSTEGHDPVNELRREQIEWDGKAATLSLFINTNPAFNTLRPEEQDRLRKKLDIMWQYSAILVQQINAAGE